MTEHLATCSCGGLVVRAQGQPLRVSVCHCLACQKRTGSAFGVQGWFAAQDVTAEGPSTQYVRVGDEGGTGRFYFCPTCGSTVYFLADHAPGMVAISVGAFADPDFAAPGVSGYEERKHGWVGLPDDIEHFD